MKIMVLFDVCTKSAEDDGASLTKATEIIRNNLSFSFL